MEQHKVKTIETPAEIGTKFGFIGASGVIQVDVNQALRREEGGFVAGSRCDHNCTLEHGGYNCGAASSLNPGLSARTFASSGQILEAIRVGAEGLGMFVENEYLTGERRDILQNSFSIPEEYINAFQESYGNSRKVVNLFGGNPELHPELFEILRGLKAEGHVVNLTTTGGRILWDDKFLPSLLSDDCKPDVIALSADDIVSIDHLNSLLSIPIGDSRGFVDIDGSKDGKNDYKSMWMSIPQSHGQERKAAEAIFVARISQEIEEFPQLLFNIVVHKGNLPFIEDQIAAFRMHFPNVKINPYFAQSSFSDGQPMFEESDLDAIGSFVQKRIDEHFDPEANLTRRLHFWLWFNSAFEVLRETNPDRLIKLLSGEFWKCYNQPGSNRVLQLGNFPGAHQDVSEAPLAPNCFWNDETVLLSQQVSQLQPEQIRDYLDGGMTAIAEKSEDPCAGCAMPRLVHDLPNMLLGIDLEDDVNKEIMKVFISKLRRILEVEGI